MMPLGDLLHAPNNHQQIGHRKDHEGSEFLGLKENKPARAVPLLHYYQRSFSTLNDGKITEHGAGFMLTFVNPDEIKQTEDITYESIDIADGVKVVIGGTREIFSNAFNIGWSNAKFTLERQASL